MSRRPLAFIAVSVGILACALTTLAQDRPPVSPGVGNAVLLATNSIQIDRDVVVVSGDVIVNNAAPGAVLGETELSLDTNVRTPAGFRVAGDGVDLDNGVVVGGDLHFNTLSNAGTIEGAQFTPLALPVYGSLPAALQRTSGSVNVVVPNNGTVELAEDGENPYGTLTVGRNATVFFTGGGYAFSSITVDRDSKLLFRGTSTVVVNGRVSIGRDSTIGPAAGSGLSASAIQFYVHGQNGGSGGPSSSPFAVNVERGNTISANLHAAAGTLAIERDAVAVGAFFARDIRIARGSRFTLASAGNNAPIANAQTVFTSDATPLTITLTGLDPDGAALAFSIVTAPTAGTLSALTPTSASSATVVYTPSSGGNLADSFTFRVTDPGAASGTAVVTINPALEDPPVTPTTVVADDATYNVFTEALSVLSLTADAPSGVGLTFAIVSGSGPSHGTLNNLTQGTESPQRSASIEYTSATGYTGADSFQFTACGVIGTSTVCDTGTATLNVLPDPAEPEDLVTDVAVSVPAEGDVLVSLSGNSLSESSGRLTLKPKAAFIDPAEIAGNVADSNNNGLGDNHNDLPGATPVLMSAGVGSSGGDGSNGTKRMQIEWDISSLGTGAGLTTAEVILHTHRGTTDSLDTHFVVGASSGDGLLTNSDFETDGEVIPGVIMPVPSSMSVGSDGTFSFPILGELRDALAQGHTHLVLQGRVDESTAGTARGLEVYTTADGNILDDKTPQLSLTTPGVIAPTIYNVLSLPANGTLFDGTTQITSVPYTLAGSAVRYVPVASFFGLDSFQFEGVLGTFSDQAFVNITVFLGNCANNAAFCQDGR